MYLKGIRSGLEIMAPGLSCYKVVKALEKAKLSMKVQANKHQNPAPDYKVNQQVWLSTDNLHMLNHTSKKLTEKWIGPYEVT